jgi:hypothetical protein
MDAHHPRCPVCGTPHPPGSAACRTCRLPLTGPEIPELGQLNAALADLDARRAVLLQRRTVLLTGLQARRQAPAPVPAWGAGWQHRGSDQPRPDTPARSVQTVLLVLGGLLINIAGLVFTLVSWGHLGIGGRTAVLTALTAVALAAPFPLRRRRLNATAEAAAAIGLALVLLDAYAARAAHVAGLQHAGPAAYWAAATALIGVCAAAYGRPTRSAFMPPAGMLLLQCTAPLAAVATSAHRTGWAAALLAAATFDFGVALLVRPTGPGSKAVVVLIARITAAVSAVTGGVLAADAALTASDYGPALRSCLPLVLLVLLGATAATRHRELPYAARVLGATLAGLALTVTLAAAPVVALPDSWSTLGPALPAALLAMAAASRLPRSPGTRPHALWAGFSGAGSFVVGSAVVVELPLLLRALAEPLRQALPSESVKAVDFPGGWRLDGAVPAVVALVAVTFGAAMLLLGRRDVGPTGADERSTAQAPYPVRVFLGSAALIAGVLAVALTPVAAGWPYPVALAASWFPGLAAAVVLVRRQDAHPAPAVSALGASLAIALVWSLPETGAMLVVWGASALLAALLATLLTTGAAARGSSDGQDWVAAGAAAFAVVVVGIEAVRAASAAGLVPHLAAFALLGVAVGMVPVAAWLSGSDARVGRAPSQGTGPAGPDSYRASLGLAVELPGYALAFIAVLMTLTYPRSLSVALAVVGAAGLGLALRGERRRGAVPLAAGALIAASWVRLGLANVHDPEAYTVTVSAAVLVLGHLRRRRSPWTTSWSAYGAGLGFTLLPSLGAAWSDDHWLRPLLLGLAALGTTLAGARRRLQAPLLVGGAVLVADALHELAPTIAQTLGLLPRWAPLAAAGLLLVFLGATYEHRLADGRRLREGFRHLR